jgi:hypothetical protein
MDLLGYFYRVRGVFILWRSHPLIHPLALERSLP